MADPRRAVIVGAGGMGKAWARNLLSLPERVVIDGWVDVREGAARSAADELGVSASYLGADLERALRQVKPDFVVDVTVPEAHHAVTLTALSAGVPVIGEKPMADSMERAREMLAASERSGKLYMVSQSRRYHDGLRALRTVVRERIGQIGVINTDFYLGPRFGGFRDAMRSPLILDMAIHTFDAVRYVSGLDPVAVYCDEFNPGWSWYAGDACATAIFEMTGAARYTYRGSWCTKGGATSWESEWRVAGERGTALWNGREGSEPYAELAIGEMKFERDVESTAAPMDRQPGGIAGSLRDFLNALDTGAAPMGECHDNIKSLAMVFAALESSRTQQRVSVVF